MGTDEKKKGGICDIENSGKNVPQTLTVCHFCISHHQGDASNRTSSA